MRTLSILRVVAVAMATSGLLSGPYDCELTEPECRRAASQAKASLWNTRWDQEDRPPTTVVSIERIPNACLEGSLYCPLVPFGQGGALVTLRYATGWAATVMVCIDETVCRGDPDLVGFTPPER
jgi:hypothetical protein